MGKNTSHNQDQQKPQVTIVEAANKNDPQTQQEVQKDIELPLSNQVTNPNVGPREGSAGPADQAQADRLQKQSDDAQQKLNDEQANIDRQKANVASTTVQVKEQQEDRERKIQEIAKNQGDSDSAKEGDLRVVEGTNVTYHVGNTDEPSAG